MQQAVTFAEVLEATGRLSVEDQEALLDILRRRVIEQRRDALVQDIAAAEKEFQEGRCLPTTPSQIAAEIQA